MSEVIKAGSNFFAGMLSSFEHDIRIEKVGDELTIDIGGSVSEYKVSEVKAASVGAMQELLGKVMSE